METHTDLPEGDYQNHMEPLTSDQILKILSRYMVRIEVTDGQYVAHYLELGYTARGVGDTEEEAVKDLIDLCLDTLADLSEDQWPKPQARLLTLLNGYSGRITATPGDLSKVPDTDEAQRFRENRIRREKQIRAWRERE